MFKRFQELPFWATEQWPSSSTRTAWCWNASAPSDLGCAGTRVHQGRSVPLKRSVTAGESGVPPQLRGISQPMKNNSNELLGRLGTISTRGREKGSEEMS